MKNFELEASEMLLRNELKAITGGRVDEGQICILTIVTSGGNTVITGQDGYPDGEAGSQAANDICVGLITNGSAQSCGYDCEYDGIGQ